MTTIDKVPFPVLGEPKTTGIIWRPRIETPVEGDAVGTLMKLLDALDDPLNQPGDHPARSLTSPRSVETVL